MDLKIRGRTALISGASKGIGFATAAVLADEGCNLILVSRTAAALDAASQSLTKTSTVSVVTHALDISKSSSVDQLVAAHPTVDILVNNAGAIPAGRLRNRREALARRLGVKGLRLRQHDARILRRNEKTRQRRHH